MVALSTIQLLSCWIPLMGVFTQSHEIQLVIALVLSTLDYRISLYFGLPQTAIDKLQLVLHFAARSIFGLNRFSHISASLKVLKWLPIREHIHRRTLFSPDYLCAPCPL